MELTFERYVINIKEITPRGDERFYFLEKIESNSYGTLSVVKTSNPFDAMQFYLYPNDDHGKGKLNKLVELVKESVVPNECEHIVRLIPVTIHIGDL